MAIVFVERNFEPPVTEEVLNELSKQAKNCFNLYSVNFMGSLISADGRWSVCVYEAPDTDSVRQAQRTAGLPFERVMPGWVYAGSAGNKLGTIPPGSEA